MNISINSAYVKLSNNQSMINRKLTWKQIMDLFCFTYYHMYNYSIMKGEEIEDAILADIMSMVKFLSSVSTNSILITALKDILYE